MRLTKNLLRLIAALFLATAPVIFIGSTAQAATHVIRIGQIFRNGPYAVKVTGIKCGLASVGISNTSLRKWASGQFCRVTLIFENESNSPQMFPGYYLVKDARGLTYADDPIANIYGNPSGAFILQVNPRYGEGFNAYFDVPKHDSLKSFLFSYQYGFPASAVTLTSQTSPAESSCQADGATVNTAIAAYEANNPGRFPTMADLLSSAHGGPYLNRAPSNPHFYRFSIAARGVLEIATVKALGPPIVYNAPVLYVGSPSCSHV